MFEYLRHKGIVRPVEWRGNVKDIDTIIVIPALAEAENLPVLIDSLDKQSADELSHSFVLVVVNNSENGSDESRSNNQQALIRLRAYMNDTTYHRLNIGLIDCASKGNELPHKDAGVGLARKIGLDSALTIFDILNDQNLLICLDADCTVTPNYLSTVRKHFQHKKCHTAVIRYEHCIPDGDQDEARAIICYESFLRYYQLGLFFAGSPYWFHTVGSTMAFDASTYIKCGGMSKHKAGEDFYFLQKAAKLYPIHFINDCCVMPSSRPSLRVPFGTGQRVARFLSNERNEYYFHDPELFVLLKKWLKLFSGIEEHSAVFILEQAEKIHSELAEFLLKQNFTGAWERIKRSPQKEIRKQQNYWFDGFRTMRLIHHLRDTAFPDIPSYEAIDILSALMKMTPPVRKETLPDMETQRNYLFFLREIILKISSS